MSNEACAEIYTRGSCPYTAGRAQICALKIGNFFIVDAEKERCNRFSFPLLPHYRHKHDERKCGMTLVHAHIVHREQIVGLLRSGSLKLGVWSPMGC